MIALWGQDLGKFRKTGCLFNGPGKFSEKLLFGGQSHGKFGDVVILTGSADNLQKGVWKRAGRPDNG